MPSRPEGERVECPTCEGSGIHYENHGPGLTEALGCDDCEGTGTIAASGERVLGWALWCDGEYSPEEVAWCNRDAPDEARKIVEREKERYGMPESFRVIPLYTTPPTGAP